MATRPSMEPMARPFPEGKNLQVRDWYLRDDSRLRTMVAVGLGVWRFWMSIIRSLLPAVDMAMR